MEPDIGSRDPDGRGRPAPPAGTSASDDRGDGPLARAEAARPLPAGLRALAEAVGDTALLPLPSPNDRVRILGKAEWTNPGRSVKARPARAMVLEAWAERLLPGRRLLDASSGNTAIAYAVLGAAGGFGVTLCVPGSASGERIRTLRAHGAELVVTDPMEGSDGAIRRARELAAERPDRFWYADQYGNPANAKSHERTTGPEIWRQTGGSVTHVVAGLGTTGTLMGVGRHLKGRDPAVRAIGVEPATPLHGIEGLKHLASAIRPPIFDASVPDRRIGVATERAQEAARKLAREAGLLVGVSSGAAWVAARKIARELEEGTVVVLLPDGGDRYLSEDWWDG